MNTMTKNPTLFHSLRAADAAALIGYTDYGSREFAVRDPEGNLWSFGSYAGEQLQ